jgi:hypothetical protein
VFIESERGWSRFSVPAGAPQRNEVMGETSQAAHQRKIERLIDLIYDTPDGDRRQRLIALLREEEAAGRRSHSCKKAGSSRPE